jgi:hypothetical protein
MDISTDLTPTEDDNEGEVEEVEPEPTSETIKLDWDTLQVGSYCDGYCNKTYRWYEAKVTDIESIPHPDNPSKIQTRYKVHFMGWNSKYDEWFDKYNDRLIKYKMSTVAMKLAEQKLTQMFPWYSDPKHLESNIRKIIADNTNSTSGSDGMPFSLLSRRVQSAIIEKIDDWCIDYTYGNPTLWLISEANLWYRIAGALSLKGGCSGAPTSLYAPYFFHFREKYLNSAHVTMVLMDLIPSLQTVNFRIVVDEVSVRTNRKVNELTILQYYQFILSQLESTETPADWTGLTKVTLQKNMFITQLNKEGVDFYQSGGIEAIKVSLLCHFLLHFFAIVVFLYVSF